MTSFDAMDAIGTVQSPQSFSIVAMSTEDNTDACKFRFFVEFNDILNMSKRKSIY